MIPAKATHEQLKRHNRQLLLRAVVSGLANSRASLAQFTGLAKPTVSDLIAELMAEGFLAEGEFGEAGEAGGKRPRLLEFIPNARQIIGASIGADGVTAVLANLSGEVSAAHYAELRGATGDAAMAILQHAINGLIAQLDAPLLCVGVGVAGIIDAANGCVVESSVLDWRERAIAAPLSAALKTPVYIGNTTELATRAQAAALPNPERLVTLLINIGVEFGMVLDGAHSFGSDIGALDPLGDGIQPLADLMSLAPFVTPHLPDHVAVGYHARFGDADALKIITNHATSLAHALKWVIGLLRPDHITLVGPVVDYGAPFLGCLQQALSTQLPAGWLEAVTVSLVSADHLSASGAVALAIQKELGHRMSGTLGVITNNANHVFQRSVLTGVREIARHGGLSVRANALEDGPLDWHDMDAIIIISNVCTDSQIEAMRAAGRSVTLVSHHIPHLPIPSLAANNDEGVRHLVRHLVEDCGRRDIAVIRGDMTQIDAVERETAIRREMMRFGLPLRDELFIRGDFDPNVARELLSALLDLRGVDFDAIIAADYLMGVAALEVLAFATVDVPGRLSVVGFGDGAEAQAAGLTTVAADVIELGRRAARQVVGQLNGLEIVGQTLFSTQLIVRKTSAP